MSSGAGDVLSELYDREFFGSYSAADAPYTASCELIAREIYRRFAPRTVVDWGCGAGLHARAMAEAGARVLGVDGSDTAIALAATHVPVIRADLSGPVDIAWERYDLSLCIDVLEHIDECHSNDVLSNIVRGAAMVILSCAPPNQGGHHHVNEQPRRYWVERMAALGWEYQRAETSDMECTFLAMGEVIAHTWMFHNLCIYLPRIPGRKIRQAYTR